MFHTFWTLHVSCDATSNELKSIQPNSRAMQFIPLIILAHVDEPILIDITFSPPL